MPHEDDHGREAWNQDGGYRGGHNDKYERDWSYSWFETKEKRDTVKDKVIELISMGVISGNPLAVTQVVLGSAFFVDIYNRVNQIFMLVPHIILLPLRHINQLKV